MNHHYYENYVMNHLHRLFLNRIIPKNVKTILYKIYFSLVYSVHSMITTNNLRNDNYILKHINLFFFHRKKRNKEKEYLNYLSVLFLDVTLFLCARFSFHNKQLWQTYQQQQQPSSKSVLYLHLISINKVKQPMPKIKTIRLISI